ncbi:hypothetical protein G6F57_010004 [Rhizopus arrhizus]|uniref:Uncharacterized protein n=1 Tax=Rhizopus oryzae TaxID=64495 RepID=A0A9P7BNY3_RHIOR|nr:hypothetical protein G6F24_002079 [Rhizopus arrhizus]KAG1414241.1 hypothetical protein G6F58_007052 [Rhizopus delemar]KAG0780722.1 hypothetical protein G6F21_011998 [Rhizopus arrhizus]KAG0780986.1 hypothetical protein G6F22_009788 [Rhizopus arrhizus]KAG0807593.1 hypothetical protein G6F20_010246 [Rhizopus arrhizus]
MSLFVARIPRDMNNRDLEDAFSKYGKITRFEVKREGFGFVEFDDKRDAEDAMKGIHETVAELVVEWAKNGGKRPSENECYHCGRSGHYARDCREGGRRDRDQRSRGGYDRRPRGGQEYRRRDDRRARSPQRGEQRYERRYDNRREYRNHSNERREERVTNRTEQPAADDERQ